MERTGIGDAELARRIPVSRPTLVRWKEGVTTRPRYREDVVRCAELLRLTDEETDEFLLAAGFSPEVVGPQSDPPARAAVTESPAAASPDSGPRFLTRHRRLLVAGILVSGLLIAAVSTILALSLRDAAVYPKALEGETLIVLAPFVNYTSGGQGFNVVGRLRPAIDSEVREAGLTAVRTVEWPREITGELAAEDAGLRSNARLVIWGEYDSGRVMARFKVMRSTNALRDQEIVDIASSPSELPATINIELTDEVRHVALLTLGQIYLDQNEFDRAKTVLIRAMDPPPSQPEAMANLRFLLGRAYLGGDLADFDEAIWLFTQVLAVWPRSVEAYNSRALAYLDRGRAGDADRAVDDLARAMTIRPERAATNLNLAVAYLERGADGDVDRALDSLTEALSAQPDYAGAYVNRAGVYVTRGGTGDLDLAFQDIQMALEIDEELSSAYLVRGITYLARGVVGDLELAIAEFSRAIELAPDSSMAYFNRGLVRSGLGDWDRSLADLRKAQELRPRDVVYNSTLCWQLAVFGDPEAALPYCDRAVASDTQDVSRDSRGLVNALLGRTDAAIADFEAFLAWVDASPKDTCRSHYGPSRTAWIESLRAGDNPFDPATLPDFRARPTAPGAEPC